MHLFWSTVTDSLSMNVWLKSHLLLHKKAPTLELLENTNLEQWEKKTLIHFQGFPFLIFNVLGNSFHNYFILFNVMLNCTQITINANIVLWFNTLFALWIFPIVSRNENVVDLIYVFSTVPSISDVYYAWKNFFFNFRLPNCSDVSFKLNNNCSWLDIAIRLPKTAGDRKQDTNKK